MKRLSRSAMLALGLFGLALKAGCGGGASPSDVCNHICECVACTSDSKVNCVEQLDGARDVAEHAGCKVAYDDYLTCMKTAPCGDIREAVEDPDEACEDQYEELEDCIEDADDDD